MTFQDSVKSGFQNYVNFSGRSTRSAYWYWVLFALILSIVTSLIDVALFTDMRPINLITSLAVFLPGLAVSARRLHDVNRSGWWMLIAFTIIGIIPLLIWYCSPGTDGGNDYGPPPLS